MIAAGWTTWALGVECSMLNVPRFRNLSLAGGKFYA